MGRQKWYNSCFATRDAMDFNHSFLLPLYCHSIVVHNHHHLCDSPPVRNFFGTYSGYVDQSHNYRIAFAFCPFLSVIAILLF
jgi:hypothetical protein